MLISFHDILFFLFFRVVPVSYIIDGEQLITFMLSVGTKFV